MNDYLRYGTHTDAKTHQMLRELDTTSALRISGNTSVVFANIRGPLPGEEYGAKNGYKFNDVWLGQ